MKLAVIARKSGETLTPVGFVPVDDSALCAGKESLFPQQPDPQKDLVRIQKDKPTVQGKRWRSICGNDDFGVWVEADKKDFEGGAAAPVTTGDGFDNSYAYLYATPAKKDFRGTTIVDTPRPRIVIQQKSKPRPGGGRINVPVQQALNTFLTERDDEFYVGRLAVYTGPYVVAAGGKLLKRGWGAVSESVPERGNITRSRLVLNVAGNYGQCRELADQLAKDNPNDSRIPHLRGWAKGENGVGELIDDRDSAMLFGRRAYSDFMNNDWTGGAPLYGFTPNFEVHNRSPRTSSDIMTQYFNMLGWFAEGMKAEALSRGHAAPQLIGYDYAGLVRQAISRLSKRQDNTGRYTADGGDIPYTFDNANLPFWLNPASMIDTFKSGSFLNPLSANNPYGRYIFENGGSIGSQEYFRYTFPVGRKKYKRDGNGNLIKRTVTSSGGKSATCLDLITDAFKTTINGEECYIMGPGQYSVCELDNYHYKQMERFAQALGDRVFIAGMVHNSWSNQKGAGLDKVKKHFWDRIYVEHKDENETTKPDGSGPALNADGQPYDVAALNRRPKNPNYVENDLLMQFMCGADNARYWEQEQPKIVTQGQTMTGTSQEGRVLDHSYATLEVIQGALLRWSQFNWLDTEITQIIVPVLPVVDQHRDRAWYDPRQEHEKKCRVVLLYCKSRSDRNKKPWVVLWADYPAAEDGMLIDLKVWANKKGTSVPRSKTYVAPMGTQCFLDDWQLDDDMSDVEPADWRFQYTDLTGETREFSGDYNIGEIMTLSIPPTLA